MAPADRRSNDFSKQPDETDATTAMIAIDVLKWPGVNQAFIVSLVAALGLSLAVIPYGKRRPQGKPRR